MQKFWCLFQCWGQEKNRIDLASRESFLRRRRFHSLLFFSRIPPLAGRPNLSLMKSFGKNTFLCPFFEKQKRVGVTQQGKLARGEVKQGRILQPPPKKEKKREVNVRDERFSLVVNNYTVWDSEGAFGGGGGSKIKTGRKERKERGNGI